MLESCALQLGLSIPSDYSKFLLQNGNGGICRDCEYEVPDLGEPVDLYEMYRLDGEMGVIEQTKRFELLEAPQFRILVFGMDSYGNPFVFRDTAVWYWDHNRDFAVELEAEINDQFYFLAESFSKFAEKVVSQREV